VESNFARLYGGGKPHPDVDVEKALQEFTQRHEGVKAANELLAKMEAEDGINFKLPEYILLRDKEYQFLGDEIDFDFHGYMGIHPDVEIPERELKRVYYALMKMSGGDFLDIPKGVGSTYNERDLLSRSRKLITRNFKMDMLKACKRFPWWTDQQWRKFNMFAKKRLDAPR